MFKCLMFHHEHVQMPNKIHAVIITIWMIASASDDHNNHTMKVSHLYVFLTGNGLSGLWGVAWVVTSGGGGGSGEAWTRLGLFLF